MEINRFKFLLESKLGEVKPLISEQETKIPEYTVKNDSVILTGQYKKTTAAAQDLKIFGGAKFVKQGDNMVANTKYQFLNVVGNQIIGVGPTPGTGSKKTYQGNVTYGCKTGKFTVNMRTDLMFYDKTLSPMLQKKCQIKVANTQDTTTPKTNQDTPKTNQDTPKSNHVCDTDKKSRTAKGKSYNYCYNGGKYYFKGTVGEYQTKHPDWTEATGKGLNAIKEKIFVKTASWEKFPCVVNHPNAKKGSMENGSWTYDINGDTYYNNGRKMTNLGMVNYTCDDPEFQS